jgi:hypothetical protein
MSKLIRLNKHDLEHLATTLESAMAIANKPQFYLWAQGALQGFIPHASLYCAYGDIEKMQFRVETFSRIPLKTEGQAADPVIELLPRIVDDWFRHGNEPRLY